MVQTQLGKRVEVIGDSLGGHANVRGVIDLLPQRLAVGEPAGEVADHHLELSQDPPGLSVLLLEKVEIAQHGVTTFHEGRQIGCHAGLLLADSTQEPRITKQTPAHHHAVRAAGRQG